MTTTPWLTAEEVQELTGLKLWKAQARCLARMAVPFILNGQGRPLVERARVVKHRERTRASEPDWSAVR